MSKKFTYKMKDLNKYLIGGGIGLILSTLANFSIAYYYHSDPVSLINSNPRWEGWEQERYKFGMNKYQTPQPTQVGTPLITEGTIIMAGDTNQMRWGFHAFEAYAKDGKSRVTLLVNKNEEEGRPLSELYYYSTAYNHTNAAYNYIKVGSDVRQHSFLFGRDKAISFGSHDFRSVIELASISPSKDIDTHYQTVQEIDSIYEPNSQAEENARCLLYIALRDARDGAMWYNKDTQRFVCKVNGKWKYLVTEDANISGL